MKLAAIKYGVLLVIVLVAGSLIATLDVVGGVSVAYWRLSELLLFATYTFCAMLAVSASIGLREPARTPGRTMAGRLMGVAAVGLGGYLLFLGVREVFEARFLRAVEVAFVVGLVGVVIHAIWVLFSGFDDLAAALRGAGAAAPPAPPGSPVESPPQPAPPPPPRDAACAACGAVLAATQRFCSECGAPAR